MDTTTAAVKCAETVATATPYNAKGRAMRMGNCPTCGKECRATGPGSQIRIPAHRPVLHA